uniref:Reverse transcriptase Ty1/copia-type domain-containing protein n=1 Tax=Solanum lycopersicum TaxID=4081 RepID=A0A3Q7I2S2_SOLLC
MTDYKSANTPMSSSESLTLSNGTHLMTDATHYLRVLHRLQYPYFSRMDIAYAKVVKRVLQYLCGTIQLGLRVTLINDFNLHVYSNANNGGDISNGCNPISWSSKKQNIASRSSTEFEYKAVANDRSETLWAYVSLPFMTSTYMCTLMRIGVETFRVSTSDYILFVGCNPIICFSKKQNIVSRSSTESEYKAVANALFETLWVINLLIDLCFLVHQLPTIYCYNLGATFLSKNPVLHSRVKHVTLDLYFVRYHVNIKSVCVIHAHGADKITDTLTKGLSKSAFENNIFKLGLLIHHLTRIGSSTLSQLKDAISQQINALENVGGQQEAHASPDIERQQTPLSQNFGAQPETPTQHVSPEETLAYFGSSNPHKRQDTHSGINSLKVNGDIFCPHEAVGDVVLAFKKASLDHRIVGAKFRSLY